MTDKVKKGRLSKVEEFYIHNNMKSKSVQDIATDLGRSVGVVTKYITGKKADPINSPDTEDPIPIPSPGEDTTNALAEPFAGTTMQKALKNARVKHKGIKIGAVMTEEMSIMSGSGKTAAHGTRFTDGAIHRPMGNNED